MLFSQRELEFSQTSVEKIKSSDNIRITPFAMEVKQKYESGKKIIVQRPINLTTKKTLRVSIYQPETDHYSSDLSANVVVDSISPNLYTKRCN